MVTAREDKKRELHAMELVGRRLHAYAKRFHSPAAKLRAEITALLAHIEARKAAGMSEKKIKNHIKIDNKKSNCKSPNSSLISRPPVY